MKKKNKIWGKIKKGARGVRVKIEKYHADAPKRRAAELEKLKKETAILKEKAAIAQERQKIKRLRDDISGGYDNPFFLSEPKKKKSDSYRWF